MRFVKYLVTLAAFMTSASAYATNFVAYTFTGSGYAQTYALDRFSGTQTSIYAPVGYFSATFYVDLDQHEIATPDLYYSNGADSFISLYNPGLHITSVSLSGNRLAGSFTSPEFYDSAINVSAVFRDPKHQFSELNDRSYVAGGNFSFEDRRRDYVMFGAGTITGFSVQAADRLGQVSMSFTAVPEASTWAMMLAGFAMIGFATRGRRSAVATVRFA